MRRTNHPPVPIGGIVIALLIVLVILLAGAPFGRGSALIFGVVGGLVYVAWTAARRRLKRGQN
jgi:Flp pilus assembly protein TadB